MSDPVTNAEVEDVLSSIRRLVSEEKHPVPAVKATTRSDKLVLTPSLRIGEDGPVQTGTDTDQHDPIDANQDDVMAFDESPPPAGPDDHGNDQSEPFELPKEAMTAPQQGQGRAEEDYAADPYNFDDENDLDGESDEALTLTSDTRSDAPWPAIKSSDADDGSERSVEAGNDVTAADVADTKAATLSAKIEALETAIGGIKDDFEPDEPDTDAYSGTQAPQMDWEDDHAGDQDQPEQDLSQRPEDVEEQQDEETFEDEIAFRHTEGDAQDTAEPDQADDDSIEDALAAQIAKESMHDSQGRIEEAVIAAAMSESVDDDQPFAFASDTPPIDEDALRDLVGDIVRSELQGALGERITRNVRKLVRREIHRALTTQDLE